MNNDTCRCHDDGCDARYDCQRFMDKGDEYTPHVASMFPFDLALGQQCPHQIPMDEEPE